MGSVKRFPLSTRAVSSSVLSGKLIMIFTVLLLACTTARMLRQIRGAAADNAADRRKARMGTVAISAPARMEPPMVMDRANISPPEKKAAM